VIVFRANQERYRSLVKSSALSVPLFNTVQRRLACEIEHEEDGHGIVANEGKHVDEFSLPAKVPY
jgi:hypothetical protein